MDIQGDVDVDDVAHATGWQHMYVEQVMLRDDALQLVVQHRVVIPPLVQDLACGRRLGLLQVERVLVQQRLTDVARVHLAVGPWVALGRVAVSRRVVERVAVRVVGLKEEPCVAVVRIDDGVGVWIGRVVAQGGGSLLTFLVLDAVVVVERLALVLDEQLAASRAVSRARLVPQVLVGDVDAAHGRANLHVLVDGEQLPKVREICSDWGQLPLVQRDVDRVLVQVPLIRVVLIPPEGDGDLVLVLVF